MEEIRANAAVPGDHTWLWRSWRVLDGLRSRRELQAARKEADDDLSRGMAPPLRLAWRVEELVATKSRLDLAHSLRTLVRDASPRYVRGASPINRLAVQDQSPTLLALADRLADVERPVAARGVVLLRRLLVSSSGPLYDPGRADELFLYLDSAGIALEPR